MSNQLCPCAKLFKIGDDYTKEHHPDCHFKAVVFQHGDSYPCVSTPDTAPVPDDLIANAKRFGELATEAIHLIKEKLSEFPQATKPVVYNPTRVSVRNIGGMFCEIEIQCECGMTIVEGATRSLPTSGYCTNCGRNYLIDYTL